MRLGDGRLSDDLRHHLHACGAHHVHDPGLRLRPAAPRRLQLRRGASLAVLARRVLAVRDGGALGADAAANNRPRALGDVSRALPAGTDFGHGVAQRDLHRLREAVTHRVAQLSVRVGTPTEDAATLRHRDRVAAAACKVDHLLVLDEALDLLGLLLADFAVAVQAPTQLAEVVVAPCVELPLLGERAHVLVPRPDLRQLQALQAHLPFHLVAVAPRLREKPREV
mmetsp:Transcript_84874/g.245231  ORF Transcript_84874/g.245231 Transcript_84874/m.245231 type:complete len:225 (+) Transcript_84874:195-869(+)